LKNKGLDMKFCSDCGGPIELKLTAGDPAPRHVCGQCHTIHYSNPKILVSCYAIWEGKPLWIRRAIAPYKGKWSAPSGFVEEGETLTEAAARELYEETGAIVETNHMELHMIGNLPGISQVYVVFRAPLAAPEFHTTEEASEVRLFSREEFPIADFAFPEVADNVHLLYDELENNQFGVYMGTLSDGENKIRRIANCLQ
jgi:ADP-ribose pyrophosphatase YjhB (NUDIX family)